MAILTVGQISPTGYTPAFAAASAGGDVFANDGRVHLHVKNGSASAITVTIASQITCNHGVNHPLTVSVGANSESKIGPFDKDRFNNANGQVSVSYSATATVTVAAIRQ